MKITLAVEEHTACTCVDSNSINVTTDVNLEAKIRQKLKTTEEDELNRAIRSVSPTSSVNNVLTTRATAASASAARRRKSSTRDLGPDGDVTPTEHEIIYYKTCLACKEQQDSCAVSQPSLPRHLFICRKQFIFPHLVV